MTETGSGVVYDGCAARRRGAGVPAIAGRSVRDRGRRRTGEGEILIRAPDAASAATATATTAGSTGPTAPRTGSPPATPATSVADGTLTVSGRIDDVITTGAEKVWPDLVERVLDAHPGVAEVAVWKRADPEWGERVVAWVVPDRRRASLDELRADRGRDHRPVGRAQGAGDRRRPPPHGGGQGPPAGARDVPPLSRTGGRTGHDAVGGATRSARCSACAACRGSSRRGRRR